MSAGVAIFCRPPSIVSDVPNKADLKGSPDRSLLTALMVSCTFTGMTPASELIFVHCSDLFYMETCKATQVDSFLCEVEDSSPNLLKFPSSRPVLILHRLACQKCRTTLRFPLRLNNIVVLNLEQDKRQPAV